MKPGKKNASRHAVNSGEWKLAATKNKTSKDVIVSKQPFQEQQQCILTEKEHDQNPITQERILDPEREREREKSKFWLFKDVFLACF
jgi:hypothetical protein